MKDPIEEKGKLAVHRLFRLPNNMGIMEKKMETTI